MSLIYQDYEDRRRRERKVPLPKKIGRKKRDIDVEAKKTPGFAVGEKLVRVLSLFGLEERDRYGIRDSLIGRPNFEHMNAEILAVMWRFIKNYQSLPSPQPPVKDFNSAKLDPLLKTALAKVDFKKLTAAQKQGLYASVFRYVNWYFMTISAADTIEAEVDEEEELSEEELSDEEEAEAEAEEEEEIEEDEIPEGKQEEL